MIVLFVSVALAADFYVAGGGSDTEPYDSWSKAANTIQAALSNAIAGDTVWVSNGVYFGSMGVVEEATNVAVIPAEVALRSVNGPAVTTINAQYGQRCVYLSGANTVLDGFTLTGGALTNYSGVFADGGGAYCSDFAQVTNCVVVSNAAYRGGGMYAEASFIYNCVFETNVATYFGGGLDCWANGDDVGCVVRQCVLRKNSSGDDGAGMYARHIQIDDCVVYENRTRNDFSNGGGLYLIYDDSYIRNSLIYSNYSLLNGGGIYLRSSGRVYSCTIVTNICGSRGGGISVYNGGTVWNSIIYNNVSGLIEGSNTYWSGSPGFYYNCCIAPLTNGANNIEEEPQVEIAGGDLLGDSPCVDVGTNQAWMIDGMDREGHDRVFNGIVDIGCQEAFVSAYDMVLSGTLQVQWSVPKAARYRWQSTLNFVSWGDVSDIRTAKTEKVVYTDALGFNERFYRVVWDRWN
jgi:hypothetical protein